MKEGTLVWSANPLSANKITKTTYKGEFVFLQNVLNLVLLS